MSARSLVLVVLGAAVGVAGCASESPHINYHWGHYEDLLYRMYSEPGAADPLEQIQMLSEDVERAAAQGQLVPPGIHAHLGYMYLLNGEPDRALEQFDLEKTEYPESTVFIDGMVNRMKSQ